ncbi:MAG: oligopeptide transporter, OPT family [Bacteroidales bacterium]|nr:oligopeptide transporter, OPT family [Bacteroidales bacterium]MDD4209449.1 oligopeptide transporter, OPT family [Bacteroidales bacterium]
MSQIEKDDIIEGLPDNAYTELKEGETYKPILLSDKKYPEINGWTVFWGIVTAIIFSAATAYSGLRFGQVFEAAIPIAIIAVGVSTFAKRKSALSENVIIQSIGASSGVIVAGAIFTLPAIYILKETNPEMQIEVNFIQIFLASLFGGFLGILFLIPFRKYFVSDMHGKYPFPEATATTEILVSGAKGGAQAKLLLISGLIGGVYDFCMTSFQLWAENISSRMADIGTKLATDFKFVFHMNGSSILLGTGFLIGLRYASIICAGSFLAWWFIVPLLGQFGVTPDGILMSTLEPEMIFSGHVRYIGIGGIAMAGIIGVIKSAGVIKTSFGMAFKTGKDTQNGNNTVLRTRKDISMKIILFGFLGVAVLMTVFFLFGGMQMNILQVVVGILVVFIFAFLFTTVAATAIATVGTNPVSGMTMMTLILSSFILSAVGLQGATGIVTALVVGGIVCSALAMAGGFITDLKIGYWIGSSPFKQQSLKFVGTLVSALTVGVVIMILSETYGYGADGLVAPQANAMAAIIEPLMFGGNTPWLLYIIGAVLAVLLDRIGIPALAFALGMFIPLALNVPLLIGGFIAWLVASRSKDEKINKARKDKGTLVASGLMAGGAIMGVVSAILKYAGVELAMPDTYIGSSLFNIIAIVMFVSLCLYLVWDSLRTKIITK